MTVSQELEAVKQWQARGLLEVLLPHMPLWITDVGRSSLLENALIQEQVRAGTERYQDERRG